MAADTNTNVCREARRGSGGGFFTSAARALSGSQVQLSTGCTRPTRGKPCQQVCSAARRGTADIPERGLSRVDLQGAGGPGAGGALPDELARAGVVDPDIGAGLGLGVHGCRMEQGSWQRTLPVGKGCGTVLPAGENRP